MSYLVIQVVWLVCVFVTPLALELYPSKLWAVPFCLVTVANGSHMIFFRYEYNAVVRKAVRILPYARYLTPSQKEPKYFLPLGAAYALFGVVSIVLVILA
ncbi:MAG: hypothetical protein ACRDTR_01300 [Rubrobacter sp.]